MVYSVDLYVWIECKRDDTDLSIFVVRPLRADDFSRPLADDFSRPLADDFSRPPNLPLHHLLYIHLIPHKGLDVP
jgi:hypothetical protein